MRRLRGRGDIPTATRGMSGLRRAAGAAPRAMRMSRPAAQPRRRARRRSPGTQPRARGGAGRRGRPRDPRQRLRLDPRQRARDLRRRRLRRQRRCAAASSWAAIVSAGPRAGHAAPSATLAVRVETINGVAAEEVSDGTRYADLGAAFLRRRSLSRPRTRRASSSPSSHLSGAGSASASAAGPAPAARRRCGCWRSSSPPTTISMCRSCSRARGPRSSPSGRPPSSSRPPSPSRPETAAQAQAIDRVIDGESASPPWWLRGCRDRRPRRS